jgi:hypothetical protein
MQNRTPPLRVDVSLDGVVATVIGREVANEPGPDHSQ